MTHEVLSPNSRTEASPTPEIKERYRLVDTGAIAIFGEEGAGKSNLAGELAKLLDARLLKGGEDMRIKAGGTSGTIGYIERSLSDDISLDEKQKQDMISSNPDNPLVNESRLSGFIATGIMQEDPSRKIIRINVTAPSKIRMARIRKRALEEWGEKKIKLFDFLNRGFVTDDEFARLADTLEAQKRELSIDKIRVKEKDRRQRDQAQWTEEFPELEGRDPLNPGTRINGEKLYDLTISTRKRSKAETLEFVVNWLIANGDMVKDGDPDLVDQPKVA